DSMVARLGSLSLQSSGHSRSIVRTRNSESESVSSCMRTPRKPVEQRVQYGALPYRSNGARTEVMLVTSRETRRWIIPKGWPHKGRTTHSSAAREAYEEAGVVGRVLQGRHGLFL